jgi:putative ABC transport system permease protein
VKTFDILEESVKAISTNKIRSGLTVLGIVIGIASVIALTAVGQGSQASITSSIESAGANLLTVSPGFTSTGRVRGAFGEAKTLLVTDSQALSELSLAKAIAPQVTGRYQIVGSAGNSNAQVISTTSSYETVRNTTMASGSFITDQNVTDYAKVAVLGSSAATDLFGDPASGGTDPVGQTIRIKSTKFTIIGVAAAKGGFGPESTDNAVFVPLSTGMRMLAGETTYLSQVSITAVDQKSMTQLQADINDLLLQRHKIADPNSADFRVQNQADLASSLSSSSRTLTLLLAAIAGISLLVGGIGIMNMMLTTVTERTREIGLRKAIGARRRDISLQFLAEAVIMTFLSGIIGVVVGWLVSLGLRHFASMNSVITVQWVVIAFGLSALIGIVFGFYPARRASGLNPIEALRYE